MPRKNVPRDERGWRIPQEGTQSRKVYDRLVAGMKPHAIAKALYRNPSTIRTMVQNIQQPETQNTQRKKQRAKLSGIRSAPLGNGASEHRPIHRERASEAQPAEDTADKLPIHGNREIV